MAYFLLQVYLARVLSQPGSTAIRCAVLVRRESPAVLISQDFRSCVATRDYIIPEFPFWNFRSNSV
jgi:hypothetical protein